jgi:hypothetical protein
MMGIAGSFLFWIEHCIPNIAFFAALIFINGLVVCLCLEMKAYLKEMLLLKPSALLFFNAFVVM